MHDTHPRHATSQIGAAQQTASSLRADSPESAIEIEIRLLAHELEKIHENLRSHHQRLSPIRHQEPPCENTKGEQVAEPVLSPIARDIRALRQRALELVVISNEIGQNLDI